jgi:hypothetical protein
LWQNASTDEANESLLSGYASRRHSERPAVERFSEGVDGKLYSPRL